MRRLVAAGCVAAEEEAAELWVTAGRSAAVMAELVARRVTGEPLGWVTGTVTFCGRPVGVAPGVYVPRWQSEQLVERAAARLTPTGRAVDVGTGSGAVALALVARHPGASVIGTEVDPRAASCARHNGVTVVVGDLLAGVPSPWAGTVDVIIAVLPYVPTPQLAFLPRDTLAFEPGVALHGGPDGLAVVSRLLHQAGRWLRTGGRVLVEIGAEQAEGVTALLHAAGFVEVDLIVDSDGDLRGAEAVWPGGAAAQAVGTAG